MTDELTAAERPTIPARYVADLFAHGSLDRAAVLARAGLSAGADRLTVAQFERLYTVARDLGDDEWFGALHHRVPRGAYATAVYLAAGCRDVAAFVAAANRFYGLFDRGHRYWDVERRGSRATLRVRCRTPAQARSILFVHATLLTPWRTAAWLINEAIPLTAVRIDPRFRAFARETAFLFGCEPELVPGAAELTFDATWLAARIARTPQHADGYARGSLGRMLAVPPPDTLELRVRSALAAGQPFASPGLAAVARQLAVSRATLARRLSGRGLSFQRIKDELRRDHAIALLDDNTPVEQVAERVGFSEPSAFARAFKAWTGVPPGHYRPRRR